MRVLIAPDKFKGTADARSVARAIERGVMRALPDAEVRCLPLADGGEGTTAILRDAIGGEWQTMRVRGPLGELIDARTALLADGRAALDVASASGLSLATPSSDGARRASSFGTGQLITAATRASREVLVALGGSATTDGGVGAARAAGWRFLDARGEEIGEGGGALVELARIAAPRADEPSRLIGLCDVDSPLLGPRGSARVYAAQKGATETDVSLLERGLENLAERIARDVGREVRGVAGGGAAGGLGAGLAAFFGAELRLGFDEVADRCGLGRELEAADLVITGEGALDEQSFFGKTPVGVARWARRAGVPCVAVCGRVTADAARLLHEGIGAWRALTERDDEIVDPIEPAIAGATESLLAEVAD